LEKEKKKGIYLAIDAVKSVEVIRKSDCLRLSPPESREIPPRNNAWNPEKHPTTRALKLELVIK